MIPEYTPHIEDTDREAAAKLRKELDENAVAARRLNMQGMLERAFALHREQAEELIQARASERKDEYRRQFIAGMIAELDRAYAKHGSEPWSRHEFYGVIKEELDEVWQDIKDDKPTHELLREIMQVAAVCLRYAETPDRHRGDHQLPLPCPPEVDMDTALLNMQADLMPGGAA